ncbi:hypothetical protein PTRG_05584 [Pyrenophora tritici-repentis Pt-1C-BFP]|uniref:Uncharacterized protein n=1 Tax=Pyrenophora tritici-repentis (strain Pt-1C-BFP) TaxID=426418 RepID=B2W6Z6_PYRTR|nr:40S ribosomal protein S30 [Pyrenophora tritici-repentis Pt-1C-BFP]EDU48504.1 hypothetical protein PTRG_05584 [Pyrenophora tritici-repentis Pt-1C-BFP]
MGKVHGSLARAGKVKSQTPKVSLPMSISRCDRRPIHQTAIVEPQEKKKTPKGRAKKRLTYTRRFVNVTMTGGKRKMNPNPTS